MREIPLSRGLVATVDDEDFDRLSEFKWSVKPYPDGCMYAVCNQKIGGRWRSVTLHKMLMEPPDGSVVVFKNFDGLDCRKDNLMVVTKAQSQHHRRTRRDCTSGDKGILFNKKAKTWTARINLGNGTTSLGTYYSWNEAAEAYDEAVQRHLGPLAPVHFPRAGEVCLDREDPTPVPLPQRNMTGVALPG